MPSPATPEELRATWTDTVAAANRVIVKLDDERRSRRPRKRRLERLEAQLLEVQESVDAAYRAFVQASSDWITASPVRHDVVVVAGTMKGATEDGGEVVVPAITFAFRGQSDADAVTVTLALPEMQMRQAQRSVSSAIDDAVRASREATKAARQG